MIPRSRQTAESEQRDVVVSHPAVGLGLTESALLFGVAALLLWLVTRVLIPAVAVRTSIEPVLLWFVGGAVAVFLPLVIAAHVMLRAERRASGWSCERLRFRRLTRNDWRWTISGAVAIALLSAISVAALTALSEAAQLHPPFMEMESLAPGRYWLLAVWLPFWMLNIAAEELLWRGVLLPRQEVSLGRWAWMVNGAGWLLFHVSFGAAILSTLWPVTFILPYVVQRTKNSSTGVLIHAAVNGPGFLVVAFGLV